MQAHSLRRFAAVFVLLAIASSLLRPLAEPDEGRYAEAAREMVSEGDWLLPRQSGQVYPDKPPGVYWAMGLFMAFLGQTAFAARLPALLAFAGLLLLLLRRTERPDDGQAQAAAWIAAGCPLLLVLGQLATLDMVLSFCVTAAILGGWAWMKDGDRGWAWLAGGCMGFGFLVKGPVAWALPLLVLAVAGLIARREVRILRLLSHRIWLPMILLGLPWYLAAVAAEPGLKDYWLDRELLGRIAADVHGRGRPIWFFPALTLGVLFPWIVGALWWRRRGEPEPRTPRTADEILVRVWALLPLLLFSIPAGKQPAYLAPAIPGLALWLAESWRHPRLRTASRVLTGLLVAGYLVGFLLFLQPENSRSDDVFADALHEADAGEWKGIQLNGWSYGLTFRLGRIDLISCGGGPRAWLYAMGQRRIDLPFTLEEQIDCVLEHFSGPEPVFLHLRDLDMPVTLLPDLQAAAEARGVGFWIWRRLGDRALAANRPPPAD